MNKFAFLTFLLALGHSILLSQITLRGTITNQVFGRSPMMSIEYWNTDHWQQAGKANINPDQSFEVALPIATPGQYRFRMFGENQVWADFIIPDSAMAQTALVFALDYTQMDGGPARTLGSKANEIYYELISQQRTLTQSDSSTADFTAFNRRCLDIASQYRKTLLGDIALLLYQPQKEDYAKNTVIEKMTANAFVKAHALEKIPFEHEHILYHNAFIKHLNRYFNYFDRDEAAGNAYIDGVMARRNGNEAVDGFLFRFLLDKMMDSKNDASLSYLLKWYAPDCADDDPQPSYIQNLLEALKVCAPGNLAPDLNFLNLDGQMVNLGASCAQYKLTFLLFWRSNCSHCKEFEPVLEEIYKKYHPLGVEVYALSSDKTEEGWRQHLQTHPTPWINVFIPKDQRSEIGQKFPAPSTPTLIALDRNRRVVTRVLSRGNLEAYLDGELSKLK